MTPYKIITLLKNTSSTNAKREILKEHRSDLDFNRVLTQIFDPRITFGIKKIPKYEYIAEDLTLNEAIDELGLLERRMHTGKNATALLQGILETVSEEDAQVIKWIIAKDCKAGFGESLINDEMFPFQVYEVP
ncbi:MAG: hypothetical protein KAI17_18055, partial [Thiotrichaceae bacterium]|nr:hypothetical protein [Thiotrichaceae bacterium]